LRDFLEETVIGETLFNELSSGKSNFLLSNEDLAHNFKVVFNTLENSSGIKSKRVGVRSISRGDSNISYKHHCVVKILTVLVELSSESRVSD